MTGLTRPVTDNRYQRALGGDSVPTTLADTLGAMFGSETLGSMALRSVRLGVAPVIDGVRAVPADRTAPEVLNERYRDLGLKFDRPMSDDDARVIADGKRAELIRDDIVARGPGGLAVIPQFGAALVGAALDPLEVAAALIPVVGPARMAWLTARFGRIGGRVAAGVAEGAIGGAITAPAMLALSRQQQLDYGMADALLDIGLGGALGGVIGGGVGVVARRADMRAADQRAVSEALAAVDDVEQMSAAEIAARLDVADGETTVRVGDDVATVRGDDPLRAQTDATPAQSRQALGAALAQTVRGEPVDVRSLIPAVSATARQRFPVLMWLRKAGGIDPDSEAAAELRSMGVTNRTLPGLFRRGGLRGVDNLPADESPFFSEGVIRGAQDADGGVTYMDRDDIYAAVRDELSGAPRRLERERAEIDAAKAAEDSLNAVDEAASESLGDLTPQERVAAFRRVMDDGVDAADAVEEQVMARELRPEAPQSDSGIPFDDIAASAEVDAILARAVDEDEADMLAMIDELRRSGDLAPDADDDLAVLAVMDTKAVAARDVSRAYAVCLAR